MRLSHYFFLSLLLALAEGVCICMCVQMCRLPLIFILQNVWVDHFGFFFVLAVAQEFDMALFEYSYARKLYYPLLSLMWICRYGVFASSVRLIHFLSHSCCTLRYHWHNTRTKSSIHLFIEIIAYAMYFQWCAHSVALNSMRMRVCIDMWTKCTRMVLIMAVSWQEVRRCTHTHTVHKRQIDSKRIEH